MIYFVSFVLIAAILFLVFFGRKLRNPSKALLNAGTTNTPSGKYYTTLARLNKKAILIPEHSRYMHTQVIGSTGSGKTRYVFFPSIYQDILRGAGCFILDVKSNMFVPIGSYVQFSGRDKDFCYFDIASPRSFTYNPLIGDDPDEVAGRISTALYSDNERNDDFYKEIGHRFIHSLVRLLYTYNNRITFSDIYQGTNDVETLTRLCQGKEDNVDAEYFIKNWIEKKEEYRQEKLIGLINKLSPFVASKWAHLINTYDPDILMEDVVMNNKVFLFGVSSQNNTSTYKALTTLTLMNLQNIIAKRYNIQKKDGFFVYLDEFKDIVYPQFADLINKAREAKIGIMLGHQSLGDLSSISKAFENTVLTNTRNKVILNLDNVESAEYFSKQIGTKKSIEKTVSYAQEGIWSVAKGHSEKLVDEFIVHPNVLKLLPTGQAILRIADSETGGRHFSVKLMHVTEKPFDINAVKRPKDDKPKIENTCGKKEKLPEKSDSIKGIETPVQNDVLGGKRVKKFTDNLSKAAKRRSKQNEKPEAAEPMPNKLKDILD